MSSGLAPAPAPGPHPAWFTEWSTTPDLVNPPTSCLLPPTMAGLASFAFWFLIFLSCTQSESYTVEEISDHSENKRFVGDDRYSWSNSNLQSHKYRHSDSEPSKLQTSSHFTRRRLKNSRKGKCKLQYLEPGTLTDAEYSVGWLKTIS